MAAQQADLDLVIKYTDAGAKKLQEDLEKITKSKKIITR